MEGSIKRTVAGASTTGAYRKCKSFGEYTEENVVISESWVCTFGAGKKTGIYVCM